MERQQELREFFKTKLKKTFENRVRDLETNTDDQLADTFLLKHLSLQVERAIEQARSSIDFAISSEAVLNTRRKESMKTKPKLIKSSSSANVLATRKKSMTSSLPLAVVLTDNRSGSQPKKVLESSPKTKRKSTHSKVKRAFSTNSLFSAKELSKKPIKDQRSSKPNQSKWKKNQKVTKQAEYDAKESSSRGSSADSAEVQF